MSQEMPDAGAHRTQLIVISNHMTVDDIVHRLNAEYRPVTETQIKHMVDRFLTWKLPDNFNPDGGISFQRTYNEYTDRPMMREPVGTNLLDATQAEAMVRHMIQGLPDDA